MIYSVSGQLLLLQPADAYYVAVIESGGIAFEIKTTMTTAAACPKKGESTRLFTYLHVREDIMELYGFADIEELNCYKMLISVSGVGPKAALSILSDLNPSQFALCIASGDNKTLTRSKGIGGKTAQRIVLELKDKISNDQIASEIAVGDSVQNVLGGGNMSEAVSALIVLGYTKSESSQALKGVDSSSSVEEMIKIALKALAR